MTSASILASRWPVRHLLVTLASGAMACARSPSPNDSESAGEAVHGTPLPTPEPTAPRPADARAVPASDVLYHSTQSGYESAEQVVLEDVASWADHWRRLHGGLEPGVTPPVDFARHVVVLAAMGQRSTGGHDIRVDGTTVAAQGGVTLHLTQLSPGATCSTIQVITAPAIALRVPRGTGTVQVRVRHETTPC